MLTRILNEFRRSEEPVSLSEMGRRLGVESSALEGMLQLLVRQGKLREIRPGGAECAHCASRFGCGAAHAGFLSGVSYELTV